MQVRPEINVQRVRRDGTAAVRLVVSRPAHPRVTIPIGIKVDPARWDRVKGRVKPSHPRAHEYNRVINQATLAIEEYIIGHPRAKGDDLRDVLLYGADRETSNMVSAMREAVEAHTERFGEGTRVVLRTMLADVAHYLPDVRVGELTAKDVQHLHRCLLAKPARGKVGTLHPNTVRHRIQKFRMAYNLVLADRGLGRADCFRDNIPKQRPTRRRYLTQAELDKLISYQPPTPDLVLVRHTFLLQVFLGGMRISDLVQLRHESLRLADGRWELNYAMQKTRVEQWVPVPAQAMEIIAHYRGRLHVLPWYTGPARNQIGGATARVNRGLKVLAGLCGIAPGLSTHWARHTFGDWARRAKIPLKTLQMIFGHSSITTTMAYMATFASEEVSDTFDALEKAMPGSVL